MKKASVIIYFKNVFSDRMIRKKKTIILNVYASNFTIRRTSSSKLYRARLAAGVMTVSSSCLIKSGANTITQ